jgi:SulP family sulfate permease
VVFLLHIPDYFKLETLQIIFHSNYGMGRINRGITYYKLSYEITGTRGNGNRECIAQGSANILNGFSSEGGGVP